MLRFAFTNNREAGDAFNTAGWTDASTRGSAFTRDHAVAGALTTLFDPQSVGDLRFQIADRRVVLRTNDAAGPGITIAGLVEFGRPYDGNRRRSEVTTRSAIPTREAQGAISGKQARPSTMYMRTQPWPTVSVELMCSPAWRTSPRAGLMIFAFARHLARSQLAME